DRELPREPHVDLIQAIEVCRARPDQRHGDARLRQARHDRPIDDVVDIERRILDAAEGLVVQHVLTGGAGRNTGITLPRPADLNLEGQRVRSGQLELREVRDVQIALVAEAKTVRIVHLAVDEYLVADAGPAEQGPFAQTRRDTHV